MEQNSPGVTVHEIIITAADINTGNLTLDDGGVEGVEDGDYVDWRITAGIPNIQTITNIYAKDNSLNVFSGDGPTKAEADGKFWHGQVSFSAEVGWQENYNIDWLDSNGNGHTFDPRIKINP